MKEPAMVDYGCCPLVKEHGQKMAERRKKVRQRSEMEIIDDGGRRDSKRGHASRHQFRQRDPSHAAHVVKLFLAHCAEILSTKSEANGHEHMQKKELYQGPLACLRLRSVTNRQASHGTTRTRLVHDGRRMPVPRGSKHQPRDLS